MHDDFSALCGITEQELLTDLKPDIERMAKANNGTYEEACAHLKRQYDGYHFSKNCADIYNPFSLFNAFDAKEYKNFWFSTGTPTFLIDILQRTDFDVQSLDGLTATDEQFDAPTDHIVDPIPVLYQSGYLTIKGYAPAFRPAGLFQRRSALWFHGVLASCTQQAHHLVNVTPSTCSPMKKRAMSPILYHFGLPGMSS